MRIGLAGRRPAPPGVTLPVFVSLLLLLSLAADRAYPLDAPHNQYGDGVVGVICSDCHCSVAEIPPGWIDTPTEPSARAAPGPAP